MPAVSSSTPAPVIAEPKNTGWTMARTGLLGQLAAHALGGTAARRRSWPASRRRGRRTAPRPRRPCRRTARRPRRCGAERRARTPIGTTSMRELGRDRSQQHRPSRAPPRSILLTKISVGTRSRRSARNSSRVCGCTPSTAETTSTAPSSTPRTRSTSAMKSGWPGVSMRLTVRPPTRERDDRGLDRDAALGARARASRSGWCRRRRCRRGR